MTHRYVVLGAGMQGTAAAYDLAKLGGASEVRLLDADAPRSEEATRRVNGLLENQVVKAGTFDARDPASVAAALRGADACLSAVPYFLNESLTRAAIQAGVHFNDLGGNTGVVERQLAMNAEAERAGVSVVPDCGVAPGMANTLAALGIRSLDRPRHVRMYCGGLPQNRSLPLGYKILFALDGLTNEYFGKALVLRGGEVKQVDTFDELEEVSFGPPLGTLQAFTTSGGTSTCPYTYRGKLETYEYKTLRYPGHYEALRTFKDLGFLEQEPLDFRGAKVTPREMFHKVMERAWTFPEELDLLVLQVNVEGEKNGQPTRWTAEIIDRQDEKTGFSAMERTTAFAAAIVTSMQAKKQTPAGAKPLEVAVDPEIFVTELKKRGIPFELRTAAI